VIGSKLDHYKILETLGEGGMGIVYKAFDVQLERYVAIKVLNPRSLNNPQFIERFKREARNQAKLNHPNIVQVYGFTEARGLLGIVMEYVEGETLENKINNSGRLRLPESINILQQILLGAAFAHSKGFVHRDLKPSNIIIDPAGNAKIMDFGISKSMFEEKGITKTGVKIGTLLYMSPEQIKAKEPTIQSDIYAIGINFYEMLYGKNPFDLGTEFEIMEAQIKKNPPKLSTLRSDIPSEIDKILNKALQKTLEKRYQTCEQFLFDVENLLSVITKKETTGKVKTLAKVDDFKSKKRRRYFFIGAGVIFLLSLVILTIFFVLQIINSSKEKSSVASNPDNERELYSGNPFFRQLTEWKSLPVPSEVNFKKISIPRENTIFLSGDSGSLLYSTTSGREWSQIENIPDINFNSHYFFANQEGFLVGEKGTIIKITDYQISDRFDLDDITLFDIHFVNDNIGFISGSNGSILKTKNRGRSWSFLKTGTDKLLFSIFFTDEMNGYAAGWEGELIKTKDGGESWEKVERKWNNYIKTIFFTNRNLGFVAGGGGEIFRTTDAGSTWQKVNSGISNGIQNILFADESLGIAVSNRGEIIVSRDGGRNWLRSDSGLFSTLTDIAINGIGEVFISGHDGKLLSNIMK
jgi:eukaryotic-like serine/threonine-protein kinase